MRRIFRGSFPRRKVEAASHPCRLERTEKRLGRRFYFAASVKKQNNCAGMSSLEIPVRRSLETD